MKIKEQKAKEYIWSFCFGIIVIAVGFGFYFSDFMIFLMSAFFSFIVFTGSQAYFRIQHNIDKSTETLGRFLKTEEEREKINENIIDLLEILIDYLEEMKEEKLKEK